MGCVHPRDSDATTGLRDTALLTRSTQLTAPVYRTRASMQAVWLFFFPHTSI